MGLKSKCSSGRSSAQTAAAITPVPSTTRRWLNTYLSSDITRASVCRSGAPGGPVNSITAGSKVRFKISAMNMPSPAITPSWDTP